MATQLADGRVIAQDRGCLHNPTRPEFSCSNLKVLELPWRPAQRRVQQPARLTIRRQHPHNQRHAQ